MTTSIEEVISTLDAARSGDLATLQDLHTSRHLQINIEDEFGAGLLHYAARSGSVDILKFLIEECGCDLKSKTKLGTTPVHDAAAAGHVTILKWMQSSRRWDMYQADKEGLTPLHVAAHQGHISVIAALIDQEMGYSLVQKTREGATPLHFAAAVGATEAVQILIARNSKLVNMQTLSGVTAVYLAAQEGHLLVLQNLFQVGGNLKVISYDGMTCMHAASQNGHLDTVEWLVATGGMSACQRDHQGATPMHYAASGGHMKVLTWLLDHETPILPDSIGGTPLHDAGIKGRLDVVFIQCIRTLVKRGDDPTRRDKNNLTVLDLLDLCLEKEIVRSSQFTPTHAHRTETFVRGGDAVKPTAIKKQIPNGDHHLNPTNTAFNHFAVITAPSLSTEKSRSLQPHPINGNFHQKTATPVHLLSKSSRSGVLVDSSTNGSESFKPPESKMSPLHHPTNVIVSSAPSPGHASILPSTTAAVNCVPPPPPPPPPLPPQDFLSFTKQSSWMDQLRKKKTMATIPTSSTKVVSQVIVGLADPGHDELIEELKKFNSKSLKKTESFGIIGGRLTRPVSMFLNNSSSLNDSGGSPTSSSGSSQVHHLSQDNDVTSSTPSSPAKLTTVSTAKIRGSVSMGCIVKETKTNGVTANILETNSNGLNSANGSVLTSIPLVDDRGRPIPNWKRELLARQLAEKMKKDEEERLQHEFIESKYRNVPQWKRAILEKKEVIIT